MILSIRRTYLSWAVAGLAIAGASPARADDPVEYNRDVRPILSETCFTCHGPDSAARKADLRLDQREAALKAEVIVPGDPENSEIIIRILSEDPNEMMPPPSSHKTLTAEQKDILRRWVAQGAEYQPHWSFIPPKRPEPPTVKDGAWPRNPIDRFVLAKLEAAGLAPAPEADRRTIARRLSLDLIGLPPEPADVEAFVNDQSPDYYEKYVDKLLASPAWGEHRGRYWLDAARYADTHGYHIDNYREMWTYRDWVIDAFNRNMPFDRFTTEQIAGDLLPNRTLDQQIASGFNRCNMTTNEGGVIPEEFLVIYTRDRTETVSQVWMGLTAGCAVCHDHKYDPLSQKEFYEMAAFFNNTTQGAMDGNIKDTPPIVFVPPAEDRDRWQALQAELGQARGQVEARKQAARSEFDSWLAAATPESLAPMVPAAGLRLSARISPRLAGETAPAPLEIAEAGDFEKDQAFSYGAWVKVTKPGTGGALVARMDDQHDFRGWDLWIEGNRIGTHIVSKWPSDALKAVATTEIPVGAWTHVLVTYDGSGKAAGVKVYYNGQPQPTQPQADTLQDSIKAEVPLKLGQRHTSSKVEGVFLSDLRIFERALSPAEAESSVGAGRALELLALPAAQRPAPEVDALYDWWLKAIDAPTKELRGKLAALEQEEGAIKTKGTIAHVMQERGEEAMAYILFRGDYDKRRDQVKASTPDFLPSFPEGAPDNRLGLAEWLLSPAHPLTARVTVNRFWQEVFGTGLVRSTGDFGLSGELPSHSELLDWMAVEFRESGWDVKRFYKLLVTSAAYRQASTATPEKVERDGANRLLSRGPRFRMDGEVIRDYVLAASGTLVRKLGGPSVRPYQPEGVWEAVAMPESNTRSYKPDSGESLYRRSVYTFWKRSAPPASMDIFNAPNREVCVVRRERTNTPLQALVTLNDPQFVEADRRLAEWTLKGGGADDDARIGFIAERLLQRPLRAEELPIVRASLQELLGFYKAHAEDAKQLIAVGDAKADPALDPTTLAAWTMLANELFNLDEVLNK